MKNLLAITILLAAITGLNSCSTAYAANYHVSWVKIGEKAVNMYGDHDEMYVKNWNNTFTKLKLKVSKAPIYVRNIRIVYGNGTSQNIVVNKRFAPGEESGALDLPGGKRVVKKIIFNYDTINTGRGKAVVTAFGRH